MIKGAMVFKSVDGAGYRVSVEKVSVDGIAAYVKFTRNSQYLPWELSDNSMWVMTDQLYPVAKTVTAATQKAKMEKTPTGRRVEMADGTSVELVSKPRRTPRKRATEIASSIKNRRMEKLIEQAESF